jgi:ferredoxin
MDALNKAMANDANLPPAKNAGLSKEPSYVNVEFLPSKKTTKAILGQNLGAIAKQAGVDIKYKCKKGECGTCSVNFNGKIVKACQVSLPATSSQKIFQVGIPQPK